MITIVVLLIHPETLHFALKYVSCFVLEMHEDKQEGGMIFYFIVRVGELVGPRPHAKMWQLGCTWARCSHLLSYVQHGEDSEEGVSCPQGMRC